MVNDRPSSRPSWHSADRRVLRELLKSPGFRYLRLPDDLEDAYRKHHQALSLRNLRQYWPLVAITYLVLAVVTAASGVAGPGMVRDLVIGFGVLAVGIGLVVAGALVPALHARLDRLVWVAAFLALLAMHIGTLVTRDSPEVLSMAQSAVTYITIATLTISNLTFRRSISATLGATACFFVLVVFTGIWPDFGQFTFYATAAILVGAMIGVTSEIRERTVFLQERLLAFEKSELDLLTQELAALSRQDALTGLANRRHFDEALRREWAIGEREGTELSLIFLDVDFFKRFNDTYGHPAGDDCLERLGHALSAALRAFDVVALYGGEEFVVLLPRTGVSTAEALAARLIAAVDELAIPHESSEVAPHVTISIGMATMIPTDSLGPDELIERADAALYRAKARGRHRFETAEP